LTKLFATPRRHSSNEIETNWKYFRVQWLACELKKVEVEKVEKQPQNKHNKYYRKHWSWLQSNWISGIFNR